MQPTKSFNTAFAWVPILIPLAVGLLLLGCETRQQAPPPAPTSEVAVITVKSQPLVLTTELPGRTSPYRVAEIRPQVNGIIKRRLFTEGSEVKEGQALYEIDPAPFQATLDSARASLAKSEANEVAVRLKYERYKSLLAEKAVSQQDYDDREAALKQAQADVQYWKAAVETAQINLDYTRVTAPISGRIGKSNVTDGALLTAHQALVLATIQQLDPIYVDVPQSTTDLLKLRRRLADSRMNDNGTDLKNVKLLLEDGSEYAIEGTLLFRDVTVDPTTGSVVLRIVFPNSEGILLPGMFVSAVVKEGLNEQAILIPQQAVGRDPKGNPFVLIVDPQNKVQRRMITLERAIGDKWLISSGLSDDDRVIVEGTQKAQPGVSVKAIPLETDGQTDRNPGNTAPSAKEIN